MNADNDDNELRNLFSGLRRQDAAHVPLFNRVVRATTPEPGFTHCWLRLAAGAAVLVAAILMLTPFQKQQTAPTADLEQWALLTGWSASTDSLLAYSSAAWETRISTGTDRWIEDSEFSSSNPIQQEQAP